MSSPQCDTRPVDEGRFVIGRRNRWTRRFSLVRLPGGPTLDAGSWGEVFTACPEFGVPWRNVEFEDNEVREEVLQAWGDHPDMPLA